MKSRLLVVHTGGVGDFICTFPALEALGQNAVVEIAGIPERAELAVAAGLAAAAHDLDRTGFHSVFTSPDARLRAFASGFDRALVWMNDADGLIQRNLTRAGIAKVDCFPGLPPDGWREHAAHWYARGAGVPATLPFSASFGAAEAHPNIVIQPGSGGRVKNWPLEHFECVAAMLEAAGHTVTWCYGPAEEALRRHRAALPPLTLAELARVLAGARLFIGNDSGVSHLAAATGCPTLAIFGPTDASRWAPAGPRVRVLRGSPWPTVEAVFEAACALAKSSSAPGD